MAGLTGHKSFQNGSFSSKIAPEKWNVGPTISYWKCAQGSTWKLCVPQKIILNMFQYANSKQLSEYHLPLHDMHMHVKKCHWHSTPIYTPKVYIDTITAGHLVSRLPTCGRMAMSTIHSVMSAASCSKHKITVPVWPCDLCMKCASHSVFTGMVAPWSPREGLCLRGRHAKAAQDSGKSL